jgi:hypothetical protein
MQTHFNRQESSTSTFKYSGESDDGGWPLDLAGMDERFVVDDLSHLTVMLKIGLASSELLDR